MTTRKDIRAFGKRLAEEYRPERIVLFGSHARGGAGPDSDVDLLVVMPTERDPVDVQVDMRMKLRPPFPLDLLVRTPQRVAERLGMGDSFMREVMEKGEVLYEASDRRMDRKG